MKIIDRHIGRAVLVGTALVLMVLSGLAAFLTLVEELDDVGQGAYGTGDAV
jgi:lipopolysaccharide export system permease protein